jgi:hypothetical protein
MLKMRAGDCLHGMLVAYIKQEIKDLKVEMKGMFSHEMLKFPVSYRLDGFYIDDEKRRAGLEIKTKYGRGVADIARKNSPGDDALTQCMIYLDAEELDYVILVYFGRDNAYRCQFVVRYIDGVLCANGKPYPHISFDESISRLRHLEHYIVNDVLPDREYMAAIRNGEIKDKFQKDKVIYKSDWQCSYCDWKDTCWADLRSLYSDDDNACMFPEEVADE